MTVDVSGRPPLTTGPIYVSDHTRNSASAAGLKPTLAVYAALTLRELGKVIWIVEQENVHSVSSSPQVLFKQENKVSGLNEILDLLNWDILFYCLFAFWCYLSRKHSQIWSYSRASGDLLFVEEFPSCYCHRPVCWVHQVINILTVFIGQSLLAPTERVTITPELQQRFHFHPLTSHSSLGTATRLAHFPQNPKWLNKDFKDLWFNFKIEVFKGPVRLEVSLISFSQLYQYGDKIILKEQNHCIQTLPCLFLRPSHKLQCTYCKMPNTHQTS